MAEGFNWYLVLRFHMATDQNRPLQISKKLGMDFPTRTWPILDTPHRTCFRGWYHILVLTHPIPTWMWKIECQNWQLKTLFSQSAMPLISSIDASIFELFMASAGNTAEAPSSSREANRLGRTLHSRICRPRGTWWAKNPIWIRYAKFGYCSLASCESWVSSFKARA